MFDEKFFQAVRKKRHYPFKNSDVTKGAEEFDWDSFMKLLDSHPEEALNLRKDKLGFVLTKLEQRSSTPYFIKNIIDELKNTFPKNSITAHFFGGFTNKSKSFDIHRDKMDVLYLQVLGSIEWSVWDEKKDPGIDILKSKNDGTKRFSQRFVCGNMIWIPRGTFHLVEPYTSRVGVSFGIEGPIDPSTYI